MSKDNLEKQNTFTTTTTHNDLNFSTGIFVMWHPTMNLRRVGVQYASDVLQQMWIDSHGNTEWREIPLFHE